MKYLDKLFSTLRRWITNLRELLDDGDFNQKLCDERMRRLSIGPYAKKNK